MSIEKETPFDAANPIWQTAAYETSFIIGFPKPRSIRRKDRIKERRRYLRAFLRVNRSGR